MAKVVTHTNKRGADSSDADMIWDIACYWQVNKIIIWLGKAVCTTEMMESGLETFLAWIIHLTDWTLKSLGNWIF